MSKAGSSGTAGSWTTDRQETAAEVGRTAENETRSEAE